MAATKKCAYAGKMKNTHYLSSRLDSYLELNSRLSLINQDELNSLLKDSEVGRGWGRNHEIVVNKKKIFVKRIPLTQLEFDHQFSTKNHYKLPLYYNYGVGSAGFGAFRELVTHIKTTNWVLSDELANFPLMYHYRILPRKVERLPLKTPQHKKYIAYWNSNKQIEKYVLARKKAPYEILIFLEHIPETCMTWLKDDLNRAEFAIKEMKKITTFLKIKNIIHFDVHLKNVLTDGKDLFVTDFGLCLDRSFDLTAKEKDFFDQHRDYDFHEFVSCLAPLLTSYLAGLSKTKQAQIKAHYKISEAAETTEIMETLYKKIEDLQKFSKIPTAFIKLFKKHKKTILGMSHFYIGLRNDQRKKARFPFS